MRNIKIKGEIYDFRAPKVMGIVNVTPDSFFAGSRVEVSRDLESRVLEMKSAGADILDLGGYSSRPGAADVSAEEEYCRLARGLEAVRRVWPEAVVSVDTFRGGVARRCVEEWGADIVNDIGGGDLDPTMFETVAELGVPYVLMHMRGTPATMSGLTDYADVTAEVLSDLSFKMGRLRELGVGDIIVDPGFGFAKTLDQNYELLRHLEDFRILEAPVLVGVSRKRMIQHVVGCGASEALNGTTVINTAALLKGASILRVHDVKEGVECVKLVRKIGINTD